MGANSKGGTGPYQSYWQHLGPRPELMTLGPHELRIVLCGLRRFCR